MTVQAMPWAIQGQSHPAENARNFVAASFGAPVAALVEGISITTAGGAHGVVGAADLTVTQRGAGANMSVDVSVGRAIIRSTEASSLAAGAYTFLNDATVNVVIAAADPTNPRIDLVIAQVRDSNYSGASTDARLTVVTGTPAGVPVTPTVPDSCIVLAQVAVAALAASIVNANITDKRTRAYALGGFAACTSATRPTGASLYEGLHIYETDTDRVWVYSGAAWIFAYNYGTLGRTGVILTDAAQSIASGGSADITWGTEVSDIDGWTSGGIATLTVPAGWDGRYAISYTGVFAAAAGASQGGQLLINGVASATSTGSTLWNNVTIACVQTLAVADTLKVQVFQNSGGNVNIVSRFEIAWLGR